jgi:LmbE family N-acetylglucosaminyl deacetylase
MRGVRPAARRELRSTDSSGSTCQTSDVPFTLVSFHAHPDDEALLTGGTLARAAAEGHRVVLVTATAGEAGLSDGTGRQPSLGERRRVELARAAAALGCARWELLDYTDSGWGPPGPDDEPRPDAFSRLDPAGPAARLAEILRREEADVLTVYDEHGGYGHPDHVQVNRVGVLAAELAGTRVVLEATVDRRKLQRVAAVLSRLPGVSRLVPDDRFAGTFLPRAELTHQVDVRRHLAAKRAALAAHHSQSTGGGSIRTVALLLRLPRPVLGLALGREWFREHGRHPAAELLDDVFASLR